MADPDATAALLGTEFVAAPKAAQPFKIVLVGQSGAGKSSCLWRLTHPDAPDLSDCAKVSTIGVDFAVYPLRIQGVEYKFNVFDTIAP